MLEKKKVIGILVIVGVELYQEKLGEEYMLFEQMVYFIKILGVWCS